MYSKFIRRIRISLQFQIFFSFNSCGSVEVPNGYKNIPDLSKRYPDCCVNIVKIINGTRIDNTIKIETTTTHENMIRAENTTKSNGTMHKIVENTTQINDHLPTINDCRSNI